MKKIYSLIVAAAMAAPAFAAAPVASSMSVANAKPVEATPAQFMNTVSKAMKAPAKAISNAEDLNGMYSMTYIWLWQGEDTFGGQLTPTFEYVGNNTIEILGIPFSDTPITASVDMSKKTITIRNQEMYNGGSFVINAKCMRWNDAGDNLLDVDAITGTIGDDGTIQFDQRDILDICQDNVYNRSYGAFYEIVMEPLQLFSFNPSEWTALNGTATLEDNLCNHFLNSPIPAVSGIKVYYNNENNNLIALENPYITGAWADVNLIADAGHSDENGYIVFDITNPEIVPMMMGVNCGFWVPADETGTTFEAIFPFNIEGKRHYLAGEELEDILNEYYANEEPCSNYNPETGLVQLMNMWFGVDTAPFSNYGFPEERDADGNVTKWYPLSYNITLPSLSGVNEIGVDANAPVKYYNLQGMEIANPAKGQLVIKTQGNKAQKVIVK